MQPNSAVGPAGPYWVTITWVCEASGRQVPGRSAAGLHGVPERFEIRLLEESITIKIIELSIYHLDDMEMLIIPKTLIKTTEVSEIMVEVPTGFEINKSIEYESLKKSITLTPEKENARDFLKNSGMNSYQS